MKIKDFQNLQRNMINQMSTEQNNSIVSEESFT